MILPCYNEELNIQKGVLDKVGNYTSSDLRFVEVLIVDDGSTDQTRKLIKDHYLGRFAKFRLIARKHQGKAYALRAGIEAARGDWVAFSDFDLATPIEEMEKLIRVARKGHSIIIGSRKGHRQGAPLMRKVMAVGFMVLRDLFIGLKGIHDTQCGFKMFRKDLAMNILDKLQVFGRPHEVKGSSVSAGFDLEFLFLAGKLGERIIEVPVTWHHVETKNVNFVKDSLETIADLYKIKLLDLKGKYNRD